MDLLKRSDTWSRYQDRYTQGAQMGVNSTARQTGATTGGYGNTYGQNAASQMGDNYMSHLYDQFSNVYGKTDRQNGSVVNADALWEQYRDGAKRGGSQAMQDTLGQYEAATGGYGNSLATSQATKAYMDYLDAANGAMVSSMKTPSRGGGKKKPEEDTGEMGKDLIIPIINSLGEQLTNTLVAYNQMGQGDDQTYYQWENDPVGDPRYGQIVASPDGNTTKRDALIAMLNGTRHPAQQQQADPYMDYLGMTNNAVTQSLTRPGKEGNEKEKVNGKGSDFSKNTLIPLVNGLGNELTRYLVAYDGAGENGQPLYRWEDTPSAGGRVVARPDGYRTNLDALYGIINGEEYQDEWQQQQQQQNRPWWDPFGWF